MKIIFGLGNPGKKYANTRHNIGFMVAEEMVARCGGSFKGKSFKSEISEYEYEGDVVVLVKPQTYMNQSGIAVRAITDFYKDQISVQENILVVLDDFALPFGKLRFREKGSAGGHQGLESILTELGTEEISRLRIGIGTIELGNRDWAEFVLERFSKEETEHLKELVTKSADACEHWIRSGTDASMQKFN